MKKMLVGLGVSALMIACNNNETKTGGTDASPSDTAAAVKPVVSGQDAELTNWLAGKMLHSTQADKTTDMYDKLKLNADGTCIDKDNNPAKWKVENGEFVFTSLIEIKKKVEKKDENNVILKGTIQDDAYTLTPIK